MIRDPIRRLRSSDSVLDRPRRVQLAALAVVCLAGLAVWTLATDLFPYHSSNDDEGVYLLQAAMLLEGQLELRAGDLADAFRPWFFVQDGGRLYSKYSPVVPAMYAVSMALFGEPRVTLVAVALGNAALVYGLGSMVFDRWVGVVAAAVFAAAPMTLLTSSVFLPYAPTTLLNCAFAVWYLRGVREGRLRHAVLAGTAIGLAFFARPYTAVLFALPFICHAGWSVLRSVRDRWWDRGLRPLPDPVRRNAATAAVGFAFVGLALAYNARVTGAALTFPYAAFAPLDGPGFGHRELLDHSLEYTPAVALEANGAALWYFATRWFTAGPLGTVAALTGTAVALWRWLPVPGSDEAGGRGSDRTAGLLLAGLFVSVPLGNFAFWGNYNVHAGVGDPTTGLLSKFGPFYHFDLLVPLSIFAGFAVVVGYRRCRDAAIRRRIATVASPRAARAVVLAVLLVGALVAGAANAALLSAPVERNAAHTDRFESAYEPVEERDLENALVFLPTPYGQWQNHPFQALRNDGGLDGEVVYALDGAPSRDFAVLDAYPSRTYYRYSYRGEWTATPSDEITARLEELSVRSGERLDGETTVGIADRVDRVRVRLENDGQVADYTVADAGSALSVAWTLERGAGTESDATANGTPVGVARLNESPNESVAFDAADELVLTVTQVQPEGATYTYRQEVTVRATDDGVDVVWPPERTGCPLVADCGTEGTYLPDHPESRSDWETFETRLEVASASSHRSGRRRVASGMGQFRHQR
ncbi:ArnT family glycosyltransferase [Natrinema salaciae]|uniref:Dolichyl-phosphate-mannose-protein mannosyltransferase n=1 Tax=Natrinema salaciae TaxID=1186196 RepID=A0A1H9LJS9_9EURY|nr:glycosyltransferase family 39 protein [Natrinema salaciae]SER11762.1 Dolichyl-phosphate-mannose-protein mannosyltransferase [Natrinema salaciae]